MVTEEQIQQWADEAKAGYDVEEIKRRGRGRPGRGAEPMQVVALRLTVEELAALDALSESERISRSEAIRRALAGFAAEDPRQRAQTRSTTPATLSKQPAGLLGASSLNHTAHRAERTKARQRMYLSWRG